MMIIKYLIKYLYLVVVVVFIVNTTASAMEKGSTVTVDPSHLGEPEDIAPMDGWILSAVKTWFRNPTVVRPERPSTIDPCIDSFVAVKKPSITLDNYIDRCFKYLNFSPHLFIIVLIYLDRITKSNERFFLNDYNVHRILFAAIYIADKMFEDDYYGLKTAARIAGLSPEDLKHLEICFLKLLQFGLYVSCEEYRYYRQILWEVYEKSVSAAPPSVARVQGATVSIGAPCDALGSLSCDFSSKCAVL